MKIGLTPEKIASLAYHALPFADYADFKYQGIND